MSGLFPHERKLVLFSYLFWEKTASVIFLDFYSIYLIFLSIYKILFDISNKTVDIL